ncbi:Oxysterol-binding [Hyphodiscus hymeniophilus]|uniref:Oxysterol-binding n=1 Tax=Hyphodiscus hymeniophilus TaxID=353542 RepID=A0A9P6VIU6_9HELO|nr:Oxysterol-binding [Hyphodiscus hymeniophilus]
MTSISQNRSTLKEFLASIATIRGDLSNITAPPFVLATQSTVEIPAYWAEHPSLFSAPALEADSSKRSLAVLRWYLTSLKAQQYGGRSEKEGVKKPLNAFLGEVFLASWCSPENGKTQLVSEQVSHHPPVTACYLWNDEAGVRAEGYTLQEISFNGSVNVKQIGHAILHVDKWDEDYLVPLPNVKVKGILSGTPYPELSGNYHIVSSSGFISEINFSGKGFLSGKKNSVDAMLYKDGDTKNPLYTVSGQWNDKMTFFEADGKEIEMIDMDTLKPTPMNVDALDQQDPWESRKAWAGVIDALNQGDMQRTVKEKSKLEEAQRELRKIEESKGRTWGALFFQNTATTDPVFEKLAKPIGEQLNSDKTVGVWKFNHEKWKNGIQRPFRGTMQPEGVELYNE